MSTFKLYNKKRNIRRNNLICVLITSTFETTKWITRYANIYICTYNTIYFIYESFNKKIVHKFSETSSVDEQNLYEWVSPIRPVLLSIKFHRRRFNQFVTITKNMKTNTRIKNEELYTHKPCLSTAGCVNTLLSAQALHIIATLYYKPTTMWLS